MEFIGMAIWLEGGSQITRFKTTTLFSVSLGVKIGIPIEPVLQEKLFNTEKALKMVPDIKPDLNKCPQYIIAVVIAYAAFT